MKSLKSVDMIKRRVYLHPCRWIKCSLVFILSINLLLLFSLFEENNIVFSATIVSHGMCEYSELPEDFSSNLTPPQDRRDFKAGDKVCVWLMLINAHGDDFYKISSDWYQPDGSKLKRTTIRFSSSFADSFITKEYEALMSLCLLKSGEEDAIGIPDVPGEWSIDLFDDSYSQHDFRYKETFTVKGDVTTTTTSVSSSSTTTSANGSSTTTTTMTNGCPSDYPIDCGDGGCCPLSHPVCGRGIHNDSCFEAGVNPYCPSSTLYGEDSYEVELLRHFRDTVLSKTHEGQELIKLYYLWSPFIVKTMEQDEEFKDGVKGIIDEILPSIEILVE